MEYLRKTYSELFERYIDPFKHSNLFPVIVNFLRLDDFDPWDQSNQSIEIIYLNEIINYMAHYDDFVECQNKVAEMIDYCKSRSETMFWDLNKIFKLLLKIDPDLDIGSIVTIFTTYAPISSKTYPPGHYLLLILTKDRSVLEKLLSHFRISFQDYMNYRIFERGDVQVRDSCLLEISYDPRTSIGSILQLLNPDHPIDELFIIDYSKDDIQSDLLESLLSHVERITVVSDNPTYQNYASQLILRIPRKLIRSDRFLTSND